jgi:hypothetical protein
MRKVEDVKNRSASEHLWRNKWIEVLFQKQLEYCDSVLGILSTTKTKNENHDADMSKFAVASNNLKLTSQTVFGENNDIVRLLDKIGYIVMENTNRNAIQQRSEEIFHELRVLSSSTEKLIKSKLKH